MDLLQSVIAKIIATIFIAFVIAASGLTIGWTYSQVRDFPIDYTTKPEFTQTVTILKEDGIRSTMLQGKKVEKVALRFEKAMDELKREQVRLNASQANITEKVACRFEKAISDLREDLEKTRSSQTVAITAMSDRLDRLISIALTKKLALSNVER